MQYRVKTPFSGYLFRLETSSSAVTFPVGTLLALLPGGRKAALLGMALVIWQGRKYSIFERDLGDKCELVASSAGGA
jgi:hypothetical protein